MGPIKYALTVTVLTAIAVIPPVLTAVKPVISAGMRAPVQQLPMEAKIPVVLIKSANPAAV